MIKLGLDFDNTLITYDEIFYKVALERNLINKDLAHQKNVIRDFLRKNNLEDQFTLLQAEVYGNRILEAEPAENLIENLLTLKQLKNIEFFIISHKTKKPIKGPAYDMHKAAKNWLYKNNFFESEGLNFKEENVFFEETKLSKIKRIQSISCTHYIDDLPEILDLLGEDCIKILYNPFGYKIKNNNWINLSSWKNLLKVFC